MPSKCFASWASPNWTRPPRRRVKNRSCSDQPQNPPPYLLGVTGHNVKHALAPPASEPHVQFREAECKRIVLVDEHDVDRIAEGVRKDRGQFKASEAGT